MRLSFYDANGWMFAEFSTEHPCPTFLPNPLALTLGQRDSHDVPPWGWPTSSGYTIDPNLNLLNGTSLTFDGGRSFNVHARNGWTVVNDYGWLVAPDDVDSPAMMSMVANPANRRVS